MGHVAPCKNPDGGNKQPGGAGSNPALAVTAGTEVHSSSMLPDPSVCWPIGEFGNSPGYVLSSSYRSSAHGVEIPAKFATKLKLKAEQSATQVEEVHP